MNKLKIIDIPVFGFLLLMCLLFLPDELYAKILILAPHPDDDVLMAAGVIAHATTRGEPVRVVYLTNGDFNGREQGYIRQNEAVQSETLYLGMKEKDLIFLGYPDGHLHRLLNGYREPGSRYSTLFDQDRTYGRRGLGFKDYHSYRFGLPAYYNCYNIIRDLYDIIYRFQPDHIFTTSACDYHSDHAAAYELLRQTLTSLAKTDIAYKPIIHTAIIHFGGIGSNLWPETGNPGKYFTKPNNFTLTGLNWCNRESIDVPLTMQSPDLRSNPKYLAIFEHQSQIQLSGFLNQFLHKDEIFWAENGSTASPTLRVQAGTDIFIREGLTCRLNGSDCKTYDKRPLVFNWHQTGGSPAGLADIGSPNPFVILPNLDTTNAPPQKHKNVESLTFQLSISDNEYSSIPDMTTVYVIPRNDEQGPKIEIRYRTIRVFNLLKQATPRVRIRGRVQDNAGITTLSYALNNNIEQPVKNVKQSSITFPETKKNVSLYEQHRQPDQSKRKCWPISQEFNIYIPVTALQENLNHIIIKATDSAGQNSFELVTITYRPDNLWTLLLILIIAFLALRSKT